MRTLVQAVRASSLPPLTAADVRSLGAAPRDALQTFLVAHALCALTEPETVALDPPVWRQGKMLLYGQCRRCGVETLVAVDVADTALHWWLVVAVALVRDHRDVFTATDGTVTPAYLHCLGRLESAIQLCVLLEQAGQTGLVH